MNITKKKDHYLFKDLHSGAEYHLSHVEYDQLGKTKAIEFVKNELKKKKSSNYTDLDIDFKRARKLGFCKYGIDDFCNRLNLDKDRVYKLSFLLKKLDVDTFLEYPSELVKLFGKSVFDKFGGVIKFLNDNKRATSLDFILRSGILSDRQLHILSTKFAMSVLHNFEDKYPDDDRPRKAIEAKLAYLDGKIDKKELIEARGESESAAHLAADLSALSAANSAESAATSASESESAETAAECALEAALWSASESSYSDEINKQIDMVIEELNK